MRTLGGKNPNGSIYGVNSGARSNQALFDSYDKSNMKFKRALRPGSAAANHSRTLKQHSTWDKFLQP